MLLLLTNQSRCPRCFSDRISRDLRRCMKCNAVLLLPGDTAVWLADQGLRSYYLWNREQGWVHSSHLANGMTKPNERFPKAEKLPDDYGKRPLPKGCSDK
jgi:hypothetical protein